MAEKKGNTKVRILYNCENIDLQITVKTVLIAALHFRYKGLLSQRSWQESRNDFELNRSLLEFSKHVYFKMYYHCEWKLAIGHYGTFRIMLRGLSKLTAKDF